MASFAETDTAFPDTACWFISTMLVNRGRIPYVGLNIKNEETHRLAKELTLMTGESMTSAVTEAIREKLNRLRQSKPAPMAVRLIEIGRDCAPRLRGTQEHGDLLYDQDGLPK